MAIATKHKPKTAKSSASKKRTAQHHRQTKHYVKSYWPYLPMVAVVAVGLFVNSLLGNQQAILGESSNVSQQALLQETNEDRRNHGQATLTSNEDLREAAQAKAEDMIARNYWSHNAPDGSTPWNFITAAGYQYQAAGENLAYGFTSADAVMNAWMKSDGHRANLLNAAYSEVGFGVAQSPNYLGKGTQTIIVAMYGLPASGSVAAAADVNTPLETMAVSRVQSYAGSAISGFIVGVIGTIAFSLVLVRHGIAWRKLVSRGELFILHHPFTDTVLVAIAVTALILSRTAGVIG